MNQLNMCQYRVKYIHCHSGGVVFIVLATGPIGCGFNPSQDDGFLRAIKICSTTSFRWEVKS
jgi:hypothetical protein